MTHVVKKDPLVKIGVPAAQAESERRLRNVRQIMEQRDAARARLDAATEERIREALSTGTADAQELPPAEATA